MFWEGGRWPVMLCILLKLNINWKAPFKGVLKSKNWHQSQYQIWNGASDFINTFFSNLQHSLSTTLWGHCCPILNLLLYIHNTNIVYFAGETGHCFLSTKQTILFCNQKFQKGQIKKCEFFIQFLLLIISCCSSCRNWFVVTELWKWLKSRK